MEDNEKLKSFLDRLSRIDHEAAINKLADACMVPRYIIYQWKAGKSKIKPIFKVTIEQTLHAKVF